MRFMSSLPDLSPLIGCVVGQVAFDFQVTLNLASQDGVHAQRVDALLAIGSDFTVTRNGDPTEVGPEARLNYAAVLPLLHETILAAAVETDGSLAISFTGDLHIRVPRSDHYESWSLAGPGVAEWIAGPR
jgi:hypothetical protein